MPTLALSMFTMRNLHGRDDASPAGVNGLDVAILRAEDVVRPVVVVSAGSPPTTGSATTGR
jgi:hypothetical protein